jgi:hypothetical protein
MNDILLIYLSGAVATLLLHVFHIAFFWAFAWLTNEHVLKSNLKKLEAPDHRKWHEKLVASSVPIAIDVFFSWLAVPFMVWKIFVRLLTVLKMRFASIPEEIKKLRFPLWNNPNMSTETVWAYSNALSVLGGDTVDWGELVRRLNNLELAVPDVDREKAIEIFEGLKVMRPRPVYEPTSENWN